MRTRERKSPANVLGGWQLSVAVGLTDLTDLDNTGHRVRVIDVEAHNSVHGETPVQVGHAAFKRHGIRRTAGTFRFHSF